MNAAADAPFTCPPEHKHDQSHTCYNNHRCRCTPCGKHAAAEALRRRREKVMGRWEQAWYPTTGVARRLQALVAIGWTAPALAVEMDLTVTAIRRILHFTFVSVERDTRHKVVTAYDRLWNIRPACDTAHHRAARDRAIARAQGYGWLPPLAWDDIDLDPEPPAVDLDERTDFDHAVVALALAGERITLTKAERLAVVEQLNTWGYSDEEIASRLGCDVRTILRDRSEHGIAAAVDASRQRTRRAA